MTKEDLLAFEQEIAQLFEAGQIRSPVHLSGGNEDDLLRIFQDIKPTDWVFSNHRSHYHALLKGIPREWLKAEILANHSITINNAEHHFFSSAIVGGNLPIAVGVALGIVRGADELTSGRKVGWLGRGEDENLHETRPPSQYPKVWCFVGDMAAETGIFHECVKFALGHQLPIHFVVEDNGVSVQTPTEKVWRYSYQHTWPHQGVGKYILF